MNLFHGSALKKSDIRKILPYRSPFSHKGENGRVLVIGGSLDYFGAPILAGLAALSGGCDLVYLLVPECNFEVSRSFYPDFIVRKYGGNFLNTRIHDALLPLLENIDAILIGPGLSKHEEVVINVKKILKRLELPAVLDADALAAVNENETRANRPLVLTPHHNEFAQLIEEPFDEETDKEFCLSAKQVINKHSKRCAFECVDEEKQKLLLKYAEKWEAVIVLKGAIDIIASPKGELAFNVTGNAGMTVGGTGDVLAGLVASFIAQKVDPFHAACAAAFLNGFAGDQLLKQKSLGFTATDVALEIPYVLHDIL